MSNNYAKIKISNNFLLGVLPNNPPDLAAGVAVEISLLAASLLLFVDNLLPEVILWDASVISRCLMDCLIWCRLSNVE